MSFSLSWALGAVLSWLIFSFTPKGSSAERLFWALVTVFVWSIFLGKQFRNPNLWPIDESRLEDVSHDSDSDYYPSSPEDVFQVRRFLVNFLPQELVNNVLDEAKYWPRIRSNRDRVLVVDASPRNKNDASLRCLVARAFLVSEALGGPLARLRVKLVEFDIFSHDQGWGGNPADEGTLPGTYNGSYTWCEAAILRPGKAPKPQGWRRWAIMLGIRRFSPPRPLFEVKNPAGGSRWLVQTNLCATSEPMDHNIVWWADGANSDTDGGSVKENGSGDGAGFIELLVPEDRIGIIARAKFSGWVNCVRSANIVVYYAV
ncbi:hypothetical protein K438DRAFT_1607571 [Mycena galopus ATCC 62051]|nr:hypothetical protein K438DRAFT_1607571 [Mycena galopus ATCC 62051]